MFRKTTFNRRRRPNPPAAALEGKDLASCIHPISKCKMPDQIPHSVLCTLCGKPVVDLLEFQKQVGADFKAHFIGFAKALLARSNESA